MIENLLEHFPRLALLDSPTPVQALSRLHAELGGPKIYVKRDDLMGIGGGGNKLRKLEYLVGQAQAEGADTLIALGALQSNHARLSAAVAAHAGMACELILVKRVPRIDDEYEKNGNMLLDSLFGARIHVLESGADLMNEAQKRADALRTEGRRPFIIPFGGSSPRGCLGYVRAASEIARQSAEMRTEFNHVIVANGSAGMHAGLLAGFHLLGTASPDIRAYSVLASASDITPLTHRLAQDTLDLIHPGHTLPAAAVRIDDSQLGAGYGLPTKETLAAVRRLAGSEGLLLDPVYTGKAFAGLLHDISTGRFRETDNVLFIMSGGLPGLFAYRSEFAA